MIRRTRRQQLLDEAAHLEANPGDSAFERGKVRDRLQEINAALALLPPPLPDWIDRRTAEWCADLCWTIRHQLLGGAGPFEKVGREWKAERAAAGDADPAALEEAASVCTAADIGLGQGAGLCSITIRTMLRGVVSPVPDLLNDDGTPRKGRP